MKLWKDMTPEEKGALLLAYHEGKVIEHTLWSEKGWFEVKKGADTALGWHDELSYRVKPEPKQPREFWLWVTPKRIMKFPYQITREDVPFLAGDEIIRVREVLE